MRSPEAPGELVIVMAEKWDFHILGSLSTLVTSKSTLPRSKHSWIGLSLPLTRSCSVSLGFPDPSQFKVEVDAPDSGLAIILSRWSAEDQKPHPCVFYPCSLLPAERNYNNENQVL